MLIQIQKNSGLKVISKTELYQNFSQNSAKPAYIKNSNIPKTGGKDFASILLSKI